ncbi:hypothetical protein EKD04_021535 [Chloroflexales bacterium ZM16-3]|nr:hypothetical protein [Chloroflexales bacterium ZM16-3]
MSTIRRNLNPDEVYTLAHGDSTTAPLHCFFAGIIYDPADDLVYRLSAPVEVQFGEDRELIILLPTLNDYPWEVELLDEPVDPEYVTVITEGPITEDNLWEFRRPDEPTQLGQPTTIDPDLHWPEWAASIRRQDAALEADGLEAILATLGFAPPTANLVPPRKSGIYVLHLADGRFYVGQSVDLTARLATHRRNYPTLRQVSLLHLPRTKAILDAREREAIHILESRGFALLNIVHASITHQSSPFDDLVLPDDQRRWLVDSTTLATGQRTIVPVDLRAKQAGKFTQLQQRSDANRIIACLRQYVAACIPMPALTEPAYWSVSCMPSTNASTWPRIACFNSNTMEVCVVGRLKDNPRQIWAFVNISNLAFRAAYPQNAPFLAIYPGATIDEVGYVAAGIDQVSIEVVGIDQLERLLRDPGILAAARLLNLHLMRKRTNFFARFHCYDLADRLI